MALTESCHEDADSVAIKRLRGMGFNVIEAVCAIPQFQNLTGTRLDNAHFTNHGGIALVSKPGINIAKNDTKLDLTMFEHLCCRVGGGLTPFLLVVIYRPGSQHVTNQFFKEFAIILESLATFKSLIIVAGDVNIDLERPSDVDSQKFCQLIDEFKLRQLIGEPTHDHGGLLDVVLTSAEEGLYDVTASESGLSDHKLIHWTISTTHPSPTYTKILRRKWKVLTLRSL